MNLQLSEEQELILQSIREFAQDASKEPDCYKVIKALADIDFLGIFYPAEYSGAGTDFTSYILATEELAKTCASTAFIYANQCSVLAYSIFQWGSAEQKQQYLPRLFSGELIGGFAFYEENPPDAETAACTARKDGDCYVLNGRKSYVINAGKGNLFVVFAHSGEELNAFIVEGRTAGIACGPALEKMGLAGVAMADLTLDNVRVPLHNLLGRAGQGQEILQGTFELHNIALAAIAAGISQEAMEKSIAYGKERVQFNRPIIKLEAIQTMIGHMATNIEAARLLTYQAARLKDAGRAYSKQAAMARFFAQQTGQEACLDAIQIHGGYGYSKDLGVEVLLRDSKGVSLFHNDETPLCLTIARNELGRR